MNTRTLLLLLVSWFVTYSAESLADEQAPNNFADGVINHLQSESTGARQEALRLVHAYRWKADSPEIPDVLAAVGKVLDDPDPSVRAAAPRALLHLSQEILNSRGEELVELLQDGHAGHQAGYTLMAAGRDSVRAFPELLQLAERDPGVRLTFRYNVDGFGQWVPEKYLCRFVLHEDELVRQKSASILRRRYFDPSPLDRNIDRRLAEEYLDMTKIRLPSVRKLGIEIYSQHNPTWAGQLAHLKQLEDDEDPGVREAALTALDSQSPSGTSDTIELLRMLESPKQHLRVHAIEQLTAEHVREAGSFKPFELLVSGIGDEDEEYSRVCLLAVGRLHLVEGANAVRAACREPEYPHRRTAFIVAGQLPASETLPTLMTLFNKDQTQRHDILKAISEQGASARAALPMLYKAFDPSEPHESARILDVILAIDPSNRASRRVMELYSLLLTQPKDPESRGDPRFSLCLRIRLHGPRAETAVPAIITCLTSTDRAAIQALQAIGPDAAEATETLRKMLADETTDERLQTYLREALNSIAT